MPVRHADHFDDSASMASMGPLLRRELPNIVRGLVTGDPTNAGMQTWPNVSSLRVGLVTSDMGTNGIVPIADPGSITESLQGCGGTTERVNYGDDGVLRRALSSRDGTNAPVLDPITTFPIDCDADGDGLDDVLSAADLPGFLTFDVTGTQPQSVYLDHVVCDVNVADDGCGFEQPLEAMLKAIAPSSITPTGGAFHAAPGEPIRSLGHGDDPATNGTWFRPDALLAIVYVSDEDDCSAANPAVYDPTSASLPDPHFADHPLAEVDTRCDRYASELHDVQRYVDGLLAARSDPSSFVFIAITGVPPDLVDDPFSGEGSANLDAILADSRMQRGQYVSVNPADPSFPSDGRVQSACVNASTGATATPGIRAIEVAIGLQRSSTGLADVFVDSICNDDFHDTTARILTNIAPSTSSCLPHALPRDASGTVACTVEEELPLGRRCAELATNGRTYVRTQSESDGDHEVCQIAQLPVTGIETGLPMVSFGHGWYYDDFSSDALACGAGQPQRMSFTPGDAPLDGSRLTLECAKPRATCDGG